MLDTSIESLLMLVSHLYKFDGCRDRLSKMIDEYSDQSELPIEELELLFAARQDLNYQCFIRKITHSNGPKS